MIPGPSLGIGTPVAGFSAYAPYLSTQWGSLVISPAQMAILQSGSGSRSVG
jgi:hypothetical protein